MRLDEYGEPTEEQVNDWNIHNDHQGDADDGHSDSEDAMREDSDEPEKPETFRIADGRLEYLKERFERIAKRARRIKCTPPTFEILSTEDVPETKIDRNILNDTYGQPVETGRVLRFHTVRLIGERPILAGHKFLGILEHADEVGLIVRTVSGESIPEQYRNADPTNCDHCHKRIKTRKETFVVEHVATKTFKQVGRQCVADFLGGTDPAAVLALVQMLSEAHEILCAGEDDEDGRTWGGRGRELYDTIYVLARASACCRNLGWVPRSKAMELGKSATADRVSEYVTASNPEKLFTDRHGNVDREAMAQYQYDDSDTAKAEAAIEWARNLSETHADSLNDYLYNLNVIAKAAAIEPKHFGLACSIIPAYDREQEKLLGIEREKKQFQASVHFGEAGKREVFILTVTRHSTFETDYGIKHVFGFQDRAGNFAVWFGTHDGGMELGKTYRAKATVKEHGEYKEIKQTVLTRVSVEEDLTEKPESEWIVEVPKRKRARAKRSIDTSAASLALAI